MEFITKHKPGLKILVALCLVSVGSLLPRFATLDGREPPARESDLKKVSLTGSIGHHPSTNVLLWTQMRSGSSFTGNLLTASPHTFYIEEPLRNGKIKGTAHSVEFLKDVLQCRFGERRRMWEMWMTSMHINDYQTKLLCMFFNGLCADADFVESMCLAIRAKVVRVVSQEMGVAAALLEEEKLRARVIHLVRDPRALLASRSRFKNGTHGKYRLASNMGFREDDKDPSLVCARYRQDMAARASIMHLYPDR